ncbi:hypothetical protein M0R45_006357 [Rubus argutus]|uniref:Uncharacterized protein n=1 Tax=Rubus argutus TaxID=59490 RepID=A0AAW1YQW9_RUBAR
MATAGTKIDVQKGILTMTVFDTTVGFHIFDAMRSPMHLGDCFCIDVVDDLVESSFIESSSKDPLETSIAHHGMEFHDEVILKEAKALSVGLPTSSLNH